MAGKEKRERDTPRVDSGASRVSQATGTMKAVGMMGTAASSKMSGSQRIKRGQPVSTFEQRSTVSKTKTKSSTRSKGGSKSSGKSGGGTRSKSSTPYRSVPAPSNDTRDTQFIQWSQNKWNNLQPHHKQRLWSFLLLGLSLLLFGTLTIFQHNKLIGGIGGFFFVIFGWAAYLIALGLVAFSLAYFIEGLRNERFIRPSMVLGSVILLLLILTESRLILGPHSFTGVLGELFVRPLLGWPDAAAHIILLGLIVVVCVFTFRITFGHMLQAGYFLRGLLSDERTRLSGNQGGQDVATGPAQYRGQRPQYSRYGTGRTPGNSVPPPSPEDIESENGIVDDEDEGVVQFESDFDNENDDPRNDINLHKDQVGIVPRGRRTPTPLDVDEHNNAVRGARQQPLPIDEHTSTISAEKLIIHDDGFMESLQPNPHRTAASSASQNAPMLNVPRTPQRTPRLMHPVPPADQNLSSWKLPDIAMLNNPDEVKLQMLGDDTATLARTIQETLRSFRVDAEVKQEDISIGPTVIRFGIRPTGKPEMKPDEKTGKPVPVRDGAGNIIYETRTRVSRIMALQNDLALVLEAKTIRMEAPVPGRPYVGVEIPNKNSRLVTLREVLESKEYQGAKAKSKLSLALGKDVAGAVRVGDLAKMPHLLIAGATGAGKSVMINAIIASFITQATPDDVRMLMVDPKMVELSMYNGIPHLLSPVVTEVEKVVSLLKNGITEMERRYRLFSQLGVRNLDGYRKMRAEKMARGDMSLQNLPAIVIIIDELADLMMAAPEEVEGMICRLAQLARATGIHLVVATQRPSVDVITGLIKANIPTRISFMVSSAVDSRTIIDMGGAERLLGRGDMLYLPADAGRPERVQGCFLTDEEAEHLVQFWRQQAAERAIANNPNTDATVLQAAVEPGWELREQDSEGDELDDDLLDKAEEVVREYGKASISLLQRRLKVGYSRAARLIDLLEEQGIIGHSESGGRAREVFDEGGTGRGGFGESHTMSDEVADIMAEEKARNDFLKKQAEQGKIPPQDDIS